jgi:hypothetical protein
MLVGDSLDDSLVKHPYNKQQQQQQDEQHSQRSIVLFYEGSIQDFEIDSN